MPTSNSTFVNQAMSAAIVKAARSTEITSVERIQSLWSGYGEILRLHLEFGLHLKEGQHRSVVLKHIKLPQPSEHPRGWNTDISHQRKLKSYRVETHWYQHFASRCDKYCPVPDCLLVEERDNETVLLLSDLAAAGFTEVKDSASQQDVHACLSWLAHFHATFLFRQPPQALEASAYSVESSVHLQGAAQGLWQQGSYWHLDTRPDELATLGDGALKAAAPLIDQALNQCRFQTLIHGDAKLANFCFSPSTETLRGSSVAAVDFQYVGGGCGMKDVAYFLGSCLSDDECEALEATLLDYYFGVLTAAVRQQHPQINPAELEREWRSMFDVAWADFHRFLKGWSPDHWKLNSYSERLTQRVIKRFNNAAPLQGASFDES